MAVRIAGIITIAAATVALFFLIRYEPPKPIAATEVQPAAPAVPMYSWSSIGTEELAMYAGQIRSLQWRSTSARLRVQVSSNEPVSFVLGDGTIATHCASGEVFTAERECEGRAGTSTIWLKDGRGGGNAITAGIAAALGEGAPLAKLAEASKVRVSVMEWKCIANCPPPTSPRKKSDRR